MTDSYRAERRTRCLLCKTRIRCDLKDGVIVHDWLGMDRPCRDPESRDNKPSKPTRKKRP